MLLHVWQSSCESLIVILLWFRLIYSFWCWDCSKTQLIFFIISGAASVTVLSFLLWCGSWEESDGSHPGVCVHSHRHLENRGDCWTENLLTVLVWAETLVDLTMSFHVSTLIYKPNWWSWALTPLLPLGSRGPCFHCHSAKAAQGLILDFQYFAKIVLNQESLLKEWLLQ